MGTDTARSSGSPQSVTRVIHILEVLCASTTPLSLAELSRELKTPKSSLAALLRGLATAGFVVAADSSFRLGPGAFGLGAALLEARRRSQSSELIREGMRRLALRTGETVLYAVRDAEGPTLTYIDIVESKNPIRFAVSVGDRRPLYCTSGGRVLLAAASQDEVRLYLKQLKPERMTPGTEINKGRLATLIASTRASGIAQTWSQTADGVTGTAAPIIDATGATIGALIVAAPSSRLQDRGAKLAKLVMEEAATISKSLGYRPGRAVEKKVAASSR